MLLRLHHPPSLIPLTLSLPVRETIPSKKIKCSESCVVSVAEIVQRKEPPLPQVEPKVKWLRKGDGDRFSSCISESARRAGYKRICNIHGYLL